MKFVEYTKDKDIAIVTMNRPKLNALNLEMMDESAETWEMVENDNSIKACILTGKGKGYCVGFDMSDLDQGKFHPSKLQTMMPQRFSPSSLTKPVIAAINGATIGAGFDFMAMDADILVAAEDATFGMPEVIYGMATLGSTFISANIPRAIAMEIALIGDSISAKRAYEVGLLNKVVPLKDLMSTCLELAGKIARNSPAAVKQSKRAVLFASAANLAARVDETFAAGRSPLLETSRKGIAAFVRKEKPVW